LLLCVLQKLALEAAKSGEFVRPSERRRQLLESQGSGNGIPGLMAGGTGDPYRLVACRPAINAGVGLLHGGANMC